MIEVVGFLGLDYKVIVFPKKSGNIMDNNGRIMKELKELQEAKKTVSLLIPHPNQQTPIIMLIWT